MLAMSDTATGMDADTVSHTFEPFFTTKGVDKGTGLGLSTVYGIVKQSDGDIVVESEMGRGTRFAIYLPRVDETVEPADAPRGAESHDGMETILLVEDEPDVRLLTRELLETEGYTVLEAAGGYEALRMAASYAPGIHLVLTRRRHAADGRSRARGAPDRDAAGDREPLHVRLHGGR